MASEERALGHSFSGARVYRAVEAGEERVVKVSDANEPLEQWRARLQILQAAADAGVAPPIARVDESTRTVASKFITGSIYPLIGNPATRNHAVQMIGELLRRVHDLPLPENTRASSATSLLASTWAEIENRPGLPAFVREAVDRMLTKETPPATDRPIVLSHNDVHPANLVVDGDQLMLVDWDQAGANDSYYDLAAITLFLNFAAPECRMLLTAHDRVAVEELPPRFVYNVRMVGVMCGAIFLKLGASRANGAGAAAGEGGEALSLSEFYQRMREGRLDLATDEGKWQFGLALIKRGIEFSDA